jgi:hypothetical protein
VALFVHLAAEKDVPGIRRAGLRFPKYRGGVYALPVLPNFFTSHQWLRELKRRGTRTIVAVYFRIPDTEPVLVGRYNREHVALTAGEAAAWVMRAPDALGMQVIVPRPIGGQEIHRVRRLPQNVGWRYQPGARAYCRDNAISPLVFPGEIKARRRRTFFMKKEIGGR